MSGFDDINNKKLYSFPSDDGFRMPAEYEPHRGTVMIWPVRPGSWPYNARDAQETFLEIASRIAQSETVWMLAAPKQADSVREKCRRCASGRDIRILEIETDDAWARDVGPTCVVNDKGEVRGIDWKFNAWGGKVDGLYAHWEKDDRAAKAICDSLGLACYDSSDFVFEGGAVHSDGEGTVIVTDACLLSPGRNPQLSKGQIEQILKKYLGAEKVIWLPHGIWQDETNEHVDNICAFVRGGEVVLAWTDDQNDPQWEFSNASLKVLENERDARGRKFIIHKLPIPAVPVCITPEELAGFVFEEGEDVRTVGERLAASYVNFYITNSSVIVPQFDDENDQKALKILGGLFRGRNIVPVYARPVIVGGGNIHCITQQIPASAAAEDKTDV